MDLSGGDFENNEIKAHRPMLSQGKVATYASFNC